jgi:hypothetical protein
MFRFFFQQKLVYCYLGFLFEFTFWIFLFLVWFLLGFVVCIWLIKFSLHSEFLSYLFIFKRWILSIKFDMFGWKWYLGNIWGGKRILPCFILISWALSTYLFSPLPYTTITNLGRFTDPLIKQFVVRESSFKTPSLRCESILCESKHASIHQHPHSTKWCYTLFILLHGSIWF